MKLLKNLRFYIVLLIFVFVSCEKEVDTQKPEISLDFAEAFPVNCDTLYFGESFQLKVRLKDNQELGSFNINIHQNFDHHSHSTEVTSCNLDTVKKDPVNEYSFISQFPIPEGVKEYETTVNINIPASNQDGQYDAGDYHFFISVTDAVGWSTPKGLSIKMLHRNE